MKCFLCIFTIALGSLMLCTPNKAEDLTTSNLVPGMSDFTRSGSTSVGQGHGCSSGEYCTSGTNGGGGTYTSNFNVPLTKDEVRQGFTLNSGITIDSHSSNSRLSTCANGVMQSGDCRDIFKLTITLKNGNTAVETFVHQEELNWAGLKNFNYADTVATNSYGVLTGILELYGIDAGYPSGFYGPQFSNPSLTIDYQTALVIEDTATVINDVIETQTHNDIMDASTVTTDVVPISTVSITTVPVLETYTSVASVQPVEPSPTPAPVTISAPTSTAETTVETTIQTPVIEPVAPAAPTITPVVQQSETQQAETQQAESQIENTIEPTPEPTSQSVSEPSPSEPQPAPKTVSKGRPQKTKGKTARKTVATTSTTAVSVPVVVTPATAAQTVVDNIAPSQKYGNTAQTVTLVAMGMIANNKSIFKGTTIPDVPNFFTSSTIPDGPSMIDRMQNYQVFGQSNGLHNDLIESQWSK